MVSITPASLTFSGGAVRDTRIAPKRLIFTGGTITTTRDTPLTTAAEIPQLNTQQRQVPIGYVDIKGQRYPVYVEAQEQLRQQRMIEAIVDAFVAVNARVDEVALYARLNAVEALAEVANDNATAAQTTVATVQTAVSQTFSAIDPIYQNTFEDLVEP